MDKAMADKEVGAHLGVMASRWAGHGEMSPAFHKPRRLPCLRPAGPAARVAWGPPSCALDHISVAWVPPAPSPTQHPPDRQAFFLPASHKKERMSSAQSAIAEAQPSVEAGATKSPTGASTFERSTSTPALSARRPHRSRTLPTAHFVREALEDAPSPKSRAGHAASEHCPTPGSDRSSATQAWTPPSSIQGMAWRCGERIGNGSYGCVHKAICLESGVLFAVKKAVLDERDPEDCRFRERLEDELKICAELRHPNIISCLGHDYQDGALYIFLEFAPGGSMADLLKEFGRLEEPVLQSCTQGLFLGLEYLHSRQPPVVHRDVKGANILLDLRMRVKLADFGCSKRSVVTESFTTVGSIPWMAPEVIRQDSHGRKADVWSAGCTCIEMASAEKPWGSKMFTNMMFALTHISLSGETPPIPDSAPACCRDLIGQCVRLSPKERPSAGDALEHDWLKEGSSRRVSKRRATYDCSRLPHT